jgi:hypothetical protein
MKPDPENQVLIILFISKVMSATPKTAAPRFTEGKPIVCGTYTREAIQRALLRVVSQTPEQRKAGRIQSFESDYAGAVHEFTATFDRDGCIVTSITCSVGGPEGYVRSITPKVFPTSYGERTGMSGAMVKEVIARACRMSVNDFNANFEITYGFIKLSDETDVTENTGTQDGKGLISKRTFRIIERRACLLCGAHITGDGALHTSTGVFGRRIDAHKACAAAPFSINARGATFTFKAAKGKLAVTETTGLTDVVACNHVLRVPQSAAAPVAAPMFPAVTIKMEAGEQVLDMSDGEESVCSKRGIDETAVQSEAETVTVKAAKKPRVEAVAAPTATSPTQLDLALSELSTLYANGTPSQLRVAALFGKYVLD